MQLAAASDIKYRTRRLGEPSVKGKRIQTKIFALLGYHPDNGVCNKAKP
jgi:hypothetical protein